MSTDATHGPKDVRRWRGARRIAPFFMLMILIPLVAACGDDSSSPGVASVDSTPTATVGDTPSDESTPTAGDDSSTGGSNEPSELAFSQCMRDHGITNFPDPDPDGGISLDGSKLGIEPDSPQFKAAEEACKQYLPNGGEPQQLDPEVREAILKYAQCMRDNGITNFPDPGPDGGIAIDGNAIDMDSPQFKAADEICKQLLPDGGEGGSTNESGGTE